MVYEQRQLIAEHKSVLDHVCQFADIAGPTVAAQSFEHLCRNHRSARRRLRPGITHEMLHERRQILDPLTERRDRNLKGIDPEEEIFSKFSQRHHFLQ